MAYWAVQRGAAMTKATTGPGNPNTACDRATPESDNPSDLCDFGYVLLTGPQLSIKLEEQRSEPSPVRDPQLDPADHWGRR